MIVGYAVILGILLGWALGGRLRNLASVKLHGEVPLLLLFGVQSSAVRIAEAVKLEEPLVLLWLALTLVLSAIALVNKTTTGMIALGAGMALNALVVAANWGMPVSLVGLETKIDKAAQLLARDPLHVPLDARTLLPVLGDTVVLPGAATTIVSVGDVVIAVGVSAVLAHAMATRHSSGSRPSHTS